ncbi:unnamed protein product [Cyclocybe aegerita]|uniref:Uncharacterized protein n=1 Tax=Cyclocybe aegerita TaxID=1973307 RepID=A0A8S0W7G2_CYCAE|nr:unnamed protein product [Cyclocybe aegerita]
MQCGRCGLYSLSEGRGDGSDGQTLEVKVDASKRDKRDSPLHHHHHLLSPLPRFSTLLITGPYHPSAPIHLTLSSKAATPESRAIILAPSRSALKGNLQQFNDAWLASRSGHGKMTELTLNDTIL